MQYCLVMELCVDNYGCSIRWHIRGHDEDYKLITPAEYDRCADDDGELFAAELCLPDGWTIPAMAETSRDSKTTMSCEVERL